MDKAFITKISRLRKLHDFVDFCEAVNSEAEYLKIVNYIKNVNRDFSTKLKPKKNDVKLPVDESNKVWVDYFKDHSFDSMNDKKNMLDLIMALTGTDVSMIVDLYGVDGSIIDVFPDLVTIRTTSHNQNDHNYGQGSIIMKMPNSRGNNVFINYNGRLGNTMSRNNRDFTVASDSQIEDFILRCLYYSSETVTMLSISTDPLPNVVSTGTETNNIGRFRVASGSHSSTNSVVLDSSNIIFRTDFNSTALPEADVEDEEDEEDEDRSWDNDDEDGDGN